MRRSALTVCVLLAAASGACKKEQPATDAATLLDSAATAAPVDTGALQHLLQCQIRPRRGGKAKTAHGINIAAPGRKIGSDGQQPRRTLR